MDNQNNNDRLFLLIDDEYTGWYLHGVFDDTEEHWTTINRIICQVDAYKVIKGHIVKEFFGEDF